MGGFCLENTRLLSKQFITVSNLHLCTVRKLLMMSTKLIKMLDYAIMIVKIQANASQFICFVLNSFFFGLKLVNLSDF